MRPEITQKDEPIVISSDQIPLYELEAKFEDDMEKKKFEYYVKKYPDRIYEIFAAIICNRGSVHIKKEHIQYFIERGVNLNKIARFSRQDDYRLGIYPGDSGNSIPLLACAEYKMCDTMELLLQLGADPLVHDGEWNVITSLFVGHYYGDNPNNTKCCLDLLSKYCDIYSFPIEKEMIEDKKNEIEEFSPFIEELINKCPVYNSIHIDSSFESSDSKIKSGDSKNNEDL